MVILPDWEGRYLMPVASGKTYVEAFTRGMNALEHLIEVAAKYGESLPEPRTYSATEEVPHA